MVALTVVLPVHNGQSFLDDAIVSIRRQTFRDFELLVIDDRSRGQLRGDHGAPRRRGRRVQLHANPGSGLVAALNLGIERADATLIARMDADDIALPERFERQMARMAAEPDLLVLGTATIRIDAKRNHLDVVVPPADPARDFQPARARQPDRPSDGRDAARRRRIRRLLSPRLSARRGLRPLAAACRARQAGQSAGAAARVPDRRQFRPELFSRQVLSEMAARAAARLRRNGGIDPTGAWDEIDAAGLAVLGIDASQVARRGRPRALQMARLFRKQKNRPGLRDALLLADAQPRKGIAAAHYMVRRARVFV